MGLQLASLNHFRTEQPNPGKFWHQYYIQPSAVTNIRCVTTMVWYQVYYSESNTDRNFKMNPEYFQIMFRKAKVCEKCFFFK